MRVFIGNMSRGDREVNKERIFGSFVKNIRRILRESLVSKRYIFDFWVHQKAFVTFSQFRRFTQLQKLGLLYCRHRFARFFLVQFRFKAHWQKIRCTSRYGHDFPIPANIDGAHANIRLIRWHWLQFSMSAFITYLGW